MGKSKKGRMMYVPPVVIDEIEDIMREDELHDSPTPNADAMKLMTKYARTGRDVFRLGKLDFTKKRALPPIDIDIPVFGKPRRKR